MTEPLDRAKKESLLFVQFERGEDSSLSGLTGLDFTGLPLGTDTYEGWIFSSKLGSLVGSATQLVVDDEDPFTYEAVSFDAAEGRYWRYAIDDDLVQMFQRTFYVRCHINIASGAASGIIDLFGFDEEDSSVMFSASSGWGVAWDHNSGSPKLTLWSRHIGTFTTQDLTGFSYDTDYYIELLFDTTVGATGTFYLSAYTGDDFSTGQVGSTVNLVQNSPKTTEFSWWKLLSSRTSGSTSDLITGTLDNLILYSDAFAQDDYEDEVRYFRYTNHDEDLAQPVSTETHTSLPEMEVSIPQLTGILREKPTSIKVPLGIADFFDDMAEGHPIERTVVKIWEWTQEEEGGQGYLRMLHRGMVIRVFRNADGSSSMIRIESENLKGEKSPIHASLGVIASHMCPWRLDDENCDPDGTDVVMSTWRQHCIVASITGTQVEIFGIDPTVDDFRFHRGFVQIGTLLIGIREWESGNTFVLSRIPPAWLLGELVLLYAGCSKTWEVCDDLYANTDHFGGIGFGIPDYHPVLEKP